MMTRVLTATLSAGVALFVLLKAGPPGLFYLGLYALALVPGLPLGWRLFGRQHPAGWVSGALLGYGLTALAFWVPVRLGLASPLGFALAWLLMTGVTWSATWRSPREPLVALPAFSTRDARPLLIVMHLVLLFVLVPLARVGEIDQTGARNYRAYFTADFVWHAALTQEVARFDLPPRNPYWASEPLHYYWTYFLVPAVIAGPESAALVPVEPALAINAATTAILTFLLVFFAAFAACERPGVAAAAVLIAFFAPSFEGVYALIDLVRRGGAIWETLRDTNIDAITAWAFRGLRVDGLVRSMWYTPQHSMSFALGLIAVLIASRMTSPSRWLTSLLTGLALGLSVVMNPFLGAAFCLIYGATVVYDVTTRRMPIMVLAHQAVAVAVVLAALGWTLLNQMGTGAGSAVTIGWFFDARHAPFVTLFLSLGGLLIPAIAGLLPWRGVAWRPAVPALFAAIVGLALMYFVTLTERSWVSFRAGNILQITLPMLAARGLAGLMAANRKPLAVVASVAVLVFGAPTTIIDTYNAQDITNRRVSAGGFRWTVSLTRTQQIGFEWLRRSTPLRAVVQADPIVRARENWSALPTFAGRRAAAGQPISLLPDPEYTRRSERAHAIAATLPPEAAHEEAKRLGIEYLWFDHEDRDAGITAGVVARLRERPDLFTTAYQQRDVTILRVN